MKNNKNNNSESSSDQSPSSQSHSTIRSSQITDQTSHSSLSRSLITDHKSQSFVVFGSTGLVGSAILKKLVEKGYKNIIATYSSSSPSKILSLFPDHFPLISNHSSEISAHCLQFTVHQSQITCTPLNLLDQMATTKFFETYQPEYVFLAAAKVGGIMANNIYRADFIYENLQIQNNVIHNAYKYGVKKLMFLGSTCIYPKNCPQPIKEEYLLTGELEYTNEPYAIAKIAGIKMCESYNLQYGTNFISVMPTNLYGPNDNFDLEKSHVLPALIRKIHLGKLLENGDFEGIKNDLLGTKVVINGKEITINKHSTKNDLLAVLSHYGITISDQQNENNDQSLLSQSQMNNRSSHVFIEIWGSGKPMREFLWSDDMADACVFIMENIDFKDTYDKSAKEIRNTHINIGTGKDISIKELAELIKDIIGFKGELYFNTDKPDGTMRKLTDVTKLHSFGWRHKVELKDGISKMYEWYVRGKM